VVWRRREAPTRKREYGPVNCSISIRSFSHTHRRAKWVEASTYNKPCPSPQYIARRESAALLQKHRRSTHPCRAQLRLIGMKSLTWWREGETKEARRDDAYDEPRRSGAGAMATKEGMLDVSESSDERRNCLVFIYLFQGSGQVSSSQCDALFCLL